MAKVPVTLPHLFLKRYRKKHSNWQLQLQKRSMAKVFLPTNSSSQQKVSCYSMSRLRVPITPDITPSKGLSHPSLKIMCGQSADCQDRKSTRLNSSHVA